MLRSMTGFGAAQGQCDGVQYTVEVRSVNNRYIKTAVKVPDIWASIETEIDKLLQARLTRGSVTLSVRMRISNENAAYTVNAAALKSYAAQLEAIDVGSLAGANVNLASLLQLPGVCEPPRLDDIREKTRDGLMELVVQAIDALVAMREQEGLVVQEDLLSQCKIVSETLSEVGARSPHVVVEYQQKLTDRVTELTRAGKVNIDEDHLAREVAIFADRSDINEEISRLTGHVEQFNKVCQSNESVGRKLDFIAQEMLREANTIGSKANDTEIARGVVEMKTAIDRIKEQVQNVM